MLLNAESLTSWQPVRLSPPEDLRFTYEEEESPEEFFVPYIWSIVVSNTTIPWNLHAIALFQPVALLTKEKSVDRQTSVPLDESSPMLAPVSEV